MIHAERQRITSEWLDAAWINYSKAVERDKPRKGLPFTPEDYEQ